MLSIDGDVVWVDVGALDQLWGLFHQGRVSMALPAAVQCVSAVYILALMFWLPDMPRWFMRHDGSEERGLMVLTRLRRLYEGHEKF